MFRVTQFLDEIPAPTPVGPKRRPPGPVVIWNLIRRCNLACQHCYSISADVDFPGELSTPEIMRTLDDLRAFGVPALILSGGEPLLHPDILAIGEINTGTYVFEAAPLVEALDRLGKDNSAGEYYLGDVLPMLREAGLRVTAHRADDPNVNLGVNTRADLAVVSAENRNLSRTMSASDTGEEFSFVHVLRSRRK